MYIWYFLQGYAMMELEAANIDRLLFELSRRGLRLRHVRRVSYTVLRAEVSRGQLRQVEELLQRQGGTMRICRRRGSWAMAMQARRHLALLGVLLLAATGAFFLSTRCLRIEVVGNAEVSEYELYHIAAEQGAVPFSAKRRETLRAIEQAVWARFPELTYVYASYAGACLRLEVREPYAAPEIHAMEPCSVYAAWDGVITSITVYRGKAMVQPGDRVQAGDLLIAGGYFVGEQEFCVHADGEVLAQVDLLESCLLEGAFTEWVPTGREAQGRVMRLGRREIPLDGESPFAHDITEQTLAAVAGENSPLYLAVYDVVYRETEEVYSEKKKQAAVLAQQEKSYFEMAAQLDKKAEILAFDTREIPLPAGIRLMITMRAKQPIGRVGEVNAPLSEES